MPNHIDFIGEDDFLKLPIPTITLHPAVRILVGQLTSSEKFQVEFWKRFSMRHKLMTVRKLKRELRSILFDPSICSLYESRWINAKYLSDVGHSLQEEQAFFFDYSCLDTTIALTRPLVTAFRST